ncbi:MAG: hypothetical protein HKN84_11605 [Gammaproteobacteria bacterium]|nr:hypothetical protein [Gammaproteobacteria bacterium]
MDKKLSSLVVIIIGAGLLLASLLADVIGIGDDVGFGPQQTTGTITGLVVLAVGVYLYRRVSGGNGGGQEPESTD